MDSSAEAAEVSWPKPPSAARVSIGGMAEILGWSAGVVREDMAGRAAASSKLKIREHVLAIFRGDYAAILNRSICRTHPISGFHLGRISTICKSLILND